MKAILDFFSNICPITGDSLIDTIIFTIIAAIAFWVAWKLTGFLADSTSSYNSTGMSALHWLIRFFVFFILLGIALGVVNIVRRVNSCPCWVHLLIGLGIGFSILAITIIIVLKNRKRLNGNDEDEED